MIIFYFILYFLFNTFLLSLVFIGFRQEPKDLFVFYFDK